MRTRRRPGTASVRSSPLPVMPPSPFTTVNGAASTQLRTYSRQTTLIAPYDHWPVLLVVTDQYGAATGRAAWLPTCCEPACLAASELAPSARSEPVVRNSRAVRLP